MKVVELAEQTTKEFGKVWDEFDRVHQKLDEAFARVDDRFAVLEARMDAMPEEIGVMIDERFKPTFNNIYNLLDRFAKQSEAHAQEMAMINRQGRRHENWIN